MEWLKSCKRYLKSRKKMLSNIASYLLGFGASPAPEEPEMKVTAVEAEDDDWLVVNTVPRSGTHSRSSSLDSAVEETWFVTPPPCFTSTGPITVETSPLENLLIEHPSMSVYRRATGVTTNPSPPTPPPSPPTPQPQAVRPPLRPAPVNTPATLPPPPCLLKKAQKAQIIKENQMIRTKNLERGNKTREVNKRNKKPRRSDRQKNHSGVNNNRKCY
ncbi:tumor protein p53-inducible nuclear protein 2 isoform X2 [Halyomorpha halys]|uniref:tumor protein p53-inducible nuclear protein 2 isoform X2 n=1 Tax=Halyomorpha halys TaxID=286706 RepID=UPI0006D51A54|nr:tumor protein p53-inducible nuclear protein 2 isoform X2 [Halyomorpha halys]